MDRLTETCGMNSLLLRALSNSQTLLTNLEFLIHLMSTIVILLMVTAIIAMKMKAPNPRSLRERMTHQKTLRILRENILFRLDFF